MHHHKRIAALAQRPLLYLLLGQVALVCGCSERLPETAPVHGVVTYDGKPLSGFKNAAVHFTPAAGRPAKSVISPNDGSFELYTYKSGDGARLGRHLVAVSATVDDPSDKDERYPGVRFIIPDKFANRDISGLEFDVKPSGNAIEIQLHSNGTGKIVAQ